MKFNSVEFCELRHHTNLGILREEIVEVNIRVSKRNTLHDLRSPESDKVLKCHFVTGKVNSCVLGEQLEQIFDLELESKISKYCCTHNITRQARERRHDLKILCIHPNINYKLSLISMI